MAKKPAAKKKALHPLKQRKRRFVVVMDDSPEAKVSLKFASARAAHVKGGTLVIFHAVRPSEFQHWRAVKDAMEAENKQQARGMLKDIATFVEEEYELTPEIVIREGNPREELQNYMEKTRDLFALFLGAATGSEPGPLVEYFSGPLCGRLDCPVVIVPGGMSDEKIDEMA